MSSMAFNASGFSVDVTKLGGAGKELAAQWFDPGEGVYQPNAGKLRRGSNQAFDPPGTPAPDNDWGLVLSASSAK